MVQSYTSDCYDAANTAQTDLQNMENNFNTLRSNFSGIAQPSNPVAGLIWMDTTGGVIKIRNSSNAAWSTMLDIDNEYALKLNRTVTAGAGLSGGGTLTSNITLSHGSHTGDVTGTTDLTIAANAITPTKTSHGFIPVLQIVSGLHEYSGTAAAWTTLFSFPIKMPSGPSAISGRARVHGSASGGTYIYYRIYIDGQTSGTLTYYAQGGYTWGNFPTACNVSGLTPGSVYTVYIQFYSISCTAYLDGIALWWE